MADRDISSSNIVLASPQQAGTIFGIDGAHPIRSKGMFYIRFLRQARDANWKNDLGFLAKTVDRPSVQPQVEEINQYNRKRIIHTGVKYQPVSATFYDTADGAAMRMWVNYAQYYFGDFNQDAANYRDDILDTKMADGGFGYGYSIRPVSSIGPGGINSQFFFTGIEVIQVWGGEYTKYTLINPRITSFDPDELDYENSAAATIHMTLSYEGIQYANGGVPMRLSAAPDLLEIFGNTSGDLGGDVVDVESVPRMTSFSGSRIDALPTNTDFTGSVDNNLAPVLGTRVNTGAISSGGGVLGRFGSFNFGAVAGHAAKSIISGNTRGLTSELAQLATGNSPLVSLLNIGRKNGVQQAASAILGNINTSSALGQRSVEAAQAALGPGGKAAVGYGAGALVRALVINQQATGTSPFASQTSVDGLAFTPEIYDAANAQSDGTAQIGSASLIPEDDYFETSENSVPATDPIEYT